jgi:hypothetical protein
MIYALKEGVRARATPGATGFCPGCGEELIARCGNVNVWHWAHQASGDCDDWYEPETAWHLGWKSVADPERCEVVMGSHRADIVDKKGVVIELQHSSISSEQIKEREEFYQSMVWIVDAREFGHNFYVSANHIGERSLWKWLHLRKSWLVAKKPIILDFGGMDIGKISLHHDNMILRLLKRNYGEDGVDQFKLDWVAIADGNYTMATPSMDTRSRLYWISEFRSDNPDLIRTWERTWNMGQGDFMSRSAVEEMLRP